MANEKADTGNDIPLDGVTIERIAAADLASLRPLLVDWMCAHLAEAGGLRAAAREKLEAIVSGVGDDELEALRAAYLACGEEYRLYPVAPLGRRLGHAFLSEAVVSAEVLGVENARAAMAAGPALFVSNHLSYADSQLAEHLTALHGDDAIARKLTFIAGPKVYENPFRRMAAVSLNTIPTAQSTRLAHNRAGASAREVAMIALQTIRSTLQLMVDGMAMVLYAEGSRSRTGRLGPFLKATCRYAQLDGLSIVPIAHTGAETSFPLHHSELARAEFKIRYGAPIPVRGSDAAGGMTEAWHALAALLPESHKPAPETPPLA
jgi:1-acyl-sn-glycerol-3-phosphate acyltransferase